MVKPSGNSSGGATAAIALNFQPNAAGRTHRPRTHKHQKYHLFGDRSCAKVYEAVWELAAILDIIRVL